MNGLRKGPGNPNFPRLVLLAAAFFGSVPAVLAQNTITDFAKCLNTRLVVAGNLKSNDVNDVNISDSVQCLPQGCKITSNVSFLSSQKAQVAELNDGPKVQEPRAMLSCPGPAFPVRLRPSWTLMPQGIPSNSVELGEEVSPLGHLVMAHVPVPPGQAWAKPDPDSVLDTPAVGLGCVACHNSGLPDPGKVKYGPTPVEVQLSRRNDPFGIARKFGASVNVLQYVIDTNDPNRLGMVKPVDPGKKQTMAGVCADIQNNLAKFPVNAVPNVNLCLAMADYQANRGCGTGNTGGGKKRHCKGITGGGTFKNGNNEMASVALDFSGQATIDTENATDTITFLDVEGTLNAVNYAKRTNISSLALTELKGTKKGADLSFTGKGTAQVSVNGGAAAAQAITAIMKLDAGKATVMILDAGSKLLVEGSTGLVGAVLRLN